MSTSTMVRLKHKISAINSPLLLSKAHIYRQSYTKAIACLYSRWSSHHRTSHDSPTLPQRSATVKTCRREESISTLESAGYQFQRVSRGCDCPVRCTKAATGTAAADIGTQGQQHAATAETTAVDDPSGPLLLTAGAFVCSFISLQIKLFDHPLPPLQVTAFSSAAAWLATGIIMKASGMSPSLGCQARKPETVSLLLLRGLLAAATVICYYSSIESLPLSVAVALFFFHPVFCVVLDAAVTGRRIPPPALGSCLLSVLGVLTIGWHDQILCYIERMMEAVQAVQAALPGTQAVQPATAAAAVQVVHSLPPAADLPVSGVLFGLAAAAANAAAFVCVGIVGPGVSPLCLTWWQHLVVAHIAAAAIIVRNLGPLEFRIGSSSFGSEVSSLVGIILNSSSSTAVGSTVAGSLPVTSSSLVVQSAEAFNSLLVDASDAISDLLDVLPSSHDTWLLLGVIMANLCGQLLLNAGFQRMDAGRGAAINTSQVLFGCIWDVALLHSAPTMAMWLGSSIIAAGVCGTALSRASAKAT